MAFVALKPCKFGGVAYLRGDSIPAGTILRERVPLLKGIGMIAEIPDSASGPETEPPVVAPPDVPERTEPETEQPEQETEQPLPEEIAQEQPEDADTNPKTTKPRTRAKK